MSATFQSPLGLALLLILPALTFGEPAPALVRPVSVTETSSEDPEFQAKLAALREKYNQDRQSLKARSARLPPEERMRLHKALLDSHQLELSKLEQDAKGHASNSRVKWEKRRDERHDRLEEVRKDGSGKRRHGREKH